MRSKLLWILCLLLCVVMVACSSNNSSNNDISDDEISDNDSSGSQENGEDESADEVEKELEEEKIEVDEEDQGESEPFKDVYDVAGIYISGNPTYDKPFIIEVGKTGYIGTYGDNVFELSDVTQGDSEEYRLSGNNSVEGSEYSSVQLQFFDGTLTISRSISGNFQRLDVLGFEYFTYDNQGTIADSLIQYIYEEGRLKVRIDSIYETDFMDINYSSFEENGICLLEVPIVDIINDVEYTLFLNAAGSYIDTEDEYVKIFDYITYEIYDENDMVDNGLVFANITENIVYEEYLDMLCGTYTGENGSTFEITESEIKLNGEILYETNVAMFDAAMNTNKNYKITNESGEPLYLLKAWDNSNALNEGEFGLDIAIYTYDTSNTVILDERFIKD